MSQSDKKDLPETEFIGMIGDDFDFSEVKIVPLSLNFNQHCGSANSHKNFTQTEWIRYVHDSPISPKSFICRIVRFNSAISTIYVIVELTEFVSSASVIPSITSQASLSEETVHLKVTDCF